MRGARNLLPRRSLSQICSRASWIDRARMHAALAIAAIATGWADTAEEEAKLAAHYARMSAAQRSSR